MTELSPFTVFARRRRIAVPEVSLFDPSALAAPALGAARFVWARRVTNETASIDVGHRLVATARELSVDPHLETALVRLEEDEAVHAALANAMLVRLGEGDHRPKDVLPPLPKESAAASFARQVVCALCIGESVSASRYAAVREVTDLPIPRACIDLFLRDEVLHGRLGFAILPIAFEALSGATNEAAARAFVEDAIRVTLRHLDATVGMDAERRGMPEGRAQPTNNPGVVEPAIDALAFYDAVTRTILPAFEAAGIGAARAWSTRWD